MVLVGRKPRRQPGRARTRAARDLRGTEADLWHAIDLDKMIDRVSDVSNNLVDVPKIAREIRDGISKAIKETINDEGGTATLKEINPNDNLYPHTIAVVESPSPKGSIKDLVQSIVESGVGQFEGSKNYDEGVAKIALEEVGSSAARPSLENKTRDSPPYGVVFYAEHLLIAKWKDVRANDTPGVYPPVPPDDPPGGPPPADLPPGTGPSDLPPGVEPIIRPPESPGPERDPEDDRPSPLPDPDPAPDPPGGVTDPDPMPDPPGGVTDPDPAPDPNPGGDRLPEADGSQLAKVELLGAAALAIGFGLLLNTDDE